MKGVARRVRSLPTWALRILDEGYDALPAGVMAEHRRAIKDELLARDLPSIADESGAHLVAPIRGSN